MDFDALRAGEGGVVVAEPGDEGFEFGVAPEPGGEVVEGARVGAGVARGGGGGGG